MYVSVYVLVYVYAYVYVYMGACTPTVLAATPSILYWKIGFMWDMCISKRVAGIL